MSLTVTVSGDHRRFAGRFDWNTAAGMWAREAEPLARGLLRSQAPFRTGRLRESVSARHEPSPGRYLILFYTTVPYARYVIEGTRPHLIVPRTARVLRWTDRAGNPSFARRVQHPGTRPDPFPERAMERAGPAVARLFAEAVAEAMRA